MSPSVHDQPLPEPINDKQCLLDSVALMADHDLLQADLFGDLLETRDSGSSSCDVDAPVTPEELESLLVDSVY